MINNPFSGRTLLRLFRSHGLQEVTVEVYPVFLTDYPLARKIMQLDQMAQEAQAAGVIDQDEFMQWQASLERSAAIGGFFTNTNIVTLAGHKP
jgi:hypothetical protein